MTEDNFEAFHSQALIMDLQMVRCRSVMCQNLVVVGEGVLGLLRNLEDHVNGPVKRERSEGGSDDGGWQDSMSHRPTQEA